MAVSITTEFAPDTAMQRAIDLIEQSGPPWSEPLIDARRILRQAIAQWNTTERLRKMDPMSVVDSVDINGVRFKREREE
jgi:hypothetical protein